jgi:2-oxoglutarate dehydrogenase E1 component
VSDQNTGAAGDADSNATDDLIDEVGPNAWLIEELHESFLRDPNSVSERWRAFFSDRVSNGATNGGRPAVTRIVPLDVPPSDGSSATAPAAPASDPSPASNPSPGPGNDPAGSETAETADQPEPLRGVAKRIVENMEASRSVPTATSFREVPAKLLEINRSVINGHLGRTIGAKVSFTHLIGYAVVRALHEHVPALNCSFTTGESGAPEIIRHSHVGLGLAIDLEKPDGSRALIVPVIPAADTLDFSAFRSAYDDLVRKAKSNRLGVDDFRGATVTLTNPGTIGTERSVPRLMPGQGAIIGVGSLAYPTAFAGADPHTIASLGLSKVITLSSTYDHRIIQGAESGTFLKIVHEMLLGDHGFYDGIFRDLGVPYEAVRWRQDHHDPGHDDGEHTHAAKQMQVSTLINMYRVRGHLIANLDPLAASVPEMHAELDPATYGLTIWDLDREFLTGSEVGIYAPVGGVIHQKLGDLLHLLRDAYCRTVGIEYMHIQDPEEKRWIQEEVEGVDSRTAPEDQQHILANLNAAEALEKFLATKYLGQKRFGIEGAESLIPILDAIIEDAADNSLDSVVLGMPHRGRLNVLANIVGKSYGELFREFEGYVDPDSIQGSGDVKYHLGATGTFSSRNGNEIPVSLAANPSHLEAVDPVVEGMARARMDQIPHDRSRRFPVLPVLMHGDAAFAGQGVVAETLNLALIKGYRVGGTIHVVVNNQLGFTTPPESARSSEYPTDIAKAVQAPIFHVNGDDPEACVRVARLAFAYRQRFHKDVVIDMVCYRRHGHNEGDDPSYTQPIMYRTIEQLPSVRALYVESLVRRSDITVEEAESAIGDFQQRMQRALEETRSSAPGPGAIAAPHPPNRGVLPHVPTGVGRGELDRVFTALNEVPAGFAVHPKLAKQFEARADLYSSGEVDWALGEALAFGSLLLEGTSVRLAGQDSRRGTFSQRHSMLFDYVTGAEYLPLSALADPPRTELWIYDSLLSEYAALGFEYGYSVVSPDTLVMWEAQFGDFSNGAQIIIDQFIVAAADKWDQESGLVMLLPHGFEGQGPEHSSARIERFLTLCAEDNIQVCAPTTAAQYFHLLRRQMLRDLRKPLVCITPKSGLRDKRWRSPLAHLTSGSFEELLPDSSSLDPAAVRRLILASGKVGVEVASRRDEVGVPVAVARIEQLYPWPTDAVARELRRFPNCTELVWLQEEPENMGPWNQIKGELYGPYEDHYEVRRVSRADEASPATGSHAIHQQEQSMLIDRALAAPGS